MKIAVIPARGGSKRIPRKNIREFCGKPIIAYSIEAARASGLFEQVIVSTDDNKIAEVAKTWGSKAPFRRPESLSDDHAGTPEVVAHATAWAQEQGWLVDAVCCIYATAPFVQPEDLRAGLDRLEEGDWDYCFTVTEYPSPVFRAFQETPDGGVEMFFPEKYSARSQDLPEALHDAGQFYWGRPHAWLDQNCLFGPRSRPLRLPRWRVQDIDTEDDWRRAELIWQAVMTQ